jgi:preprotein translocase subunit YajC
MLTYFDKEVNFNRIFGRGTLQMPNAANAQQWIDKIENDLSPENLTCDGELPRSQVLAKSRELHKALAEVQALQVGRVHTGTTFPVSDPFAAKYALAFTAVRSSQRRERTRSRAIALNTAVNEGFKVGTKVRLSNGLVGTITKINRTRVKVLTETRGTWNVPPACMKKA